MNNDTTPCGIMSGLLSRDQLAAELGVTKRCLELWAVRREGPPRVKIGRKVFYAVADVRYWINSRKAS